MVKASLALSLDDLEARRNDVLARIVERLTGDDRVVAVWLTGSFGRNEDDAWSDYDLHLAIEDEHLDAWWEARASLFHDIAPVAFVQPEMPSNAQDGAHFQLVYFAGPIEVDWNVGRVSQAVMPATSQVLFTRREIPATPPQTLGEDERRDRLQHAADFFWAMTPIAVKYCGRGATSDAVDQIDLMVMSLTTTWRLLRRSDNVFSKNPRMEPELDAILPRLRTSIDPAQCLDQVVALVSVMTDLKPGLDEAGVIWPGLLVEQVGGIVKVARIVIGEGSAASDQ